MFNNFFKRMENNPNRYKPSNKPVNTPEHNKDDGQKYLKDLGKLLCVVTERDSLGCDHPIIKQIYTGNWYNIVLKLTDDDIVLKLSDDDKMYNFDLNQKTTGVLYEEYDKDFKNSISENDYYKTNPKLIYEFVSTHGDIAMYVVPMSEVEDLDKNTTGGGRRRKTHKNKRK